MSSSQFIIDILWESVNEMFVFLFRNTIHIVCLRTPNTIRTKKYCTQNVWYVAQILMQSVRQKATSMQI